MSTRQQLIKARLGVLKLAAELKNVSLACKMSGVSRSQYYRIKKSYETQGSDGLAPRVHWRARRSPHTPPEIEKLILIMTQQYPTISYMRLATRLKLDGISVSPPMVRVVWQRHGLTTRASRISWLGRRPESHSPHTTGRGRQLPPSAKRPDSAGFLSPS